MDPGVLDPERRCGRVPGSEIGESLNGGGGAQRWATFDVSKTHRDRRQNGQVSTVRCGTDGQVEGQTGPVGNCVDGWRDGGLGVWVRCGAVRCVAVHAVCGRGRDVTS